MGNKLVLGCVNDEGAVFHILADSQETQVTNASLDNYLVIVLNVFGSGRNQYYSIIVTGLFLVVSKPEQSQLTPLGRTAIIDGEMETFTDVQHSGAASALILMMASLMVFIPTACCTSEQPRY